MKRKLVFAADSETYQQGLEEALVMGLSSGFDLHVITDLHYLEGFFREERELDVLVTAEEFYGEYLNRHRIGKIYVLSPDAEHFCAVGPQAEAVSEKIAPELLAAIIAGDDGGRIDG